MSLLSKVLPFLFEETPPLSLEKFAALPAIEKQRLIREGNASPAVMAGLIGDEDIDVRVLLAQRLSSLLPKLKSDDQETSALVLGAIRQLTEDSVTPVRVALSSALKDIAKTPPAIARKLADDAERAVSEPIIRYSLSLSDEDLLSLLAEYPQSWHSESIASRRKLSSPVSNAVIATGNALATRALLANDTVQLNDIVINALRDNPDYTLDLQGRDKFQRKIKRDINLLVERSLYSFLRSNAHLDKSTTADVLEKMHQRVTSQETLADIPPGDLTEEQIRDAVLLGETAIALRAIAARAKTDENTVRRMLVDSGAAKPVIALCIKAGLSMAFALLCQQRLTRLPPEKIFYPVDGNKIPISQDEIKWQWDFFGI